MRLFLIVSISLAMVGCFKSEEQVKQAHKEEMMKQFVNQKRDHRSLEERVRDAQKRQRTRSEPM